MANEMILLILGRIALLLLNSRLRKSAVEVEWADLPPELLAIVSGGLGNPSDIVAFRSVCRSWRSFTPPPPNILCPICPLKAPLEGAEPYLSLSGDQEITASALCLVSPKSDPSNAWLVAVQEATAGKFVLRHALSYTEMIGESGLDLEGDWITSTQIAKFYTHNLPCWTCKGGDGVRFTKPVVLVSSPNPNSSGSGCKELVGLFSYPQWVLFAFRHDLRGGCFKAKSIGINVSIEDYVEFEGRIYAVAVSGHIYLLDNRSLQLVRVTETPKPSRYDIEGFHKTQFVISDGALYLVRCYYDDPSASEIDRLVVVMTEGNRRIVREAIHNLGDKIFFLTQKSSFSIPARLLPHPWRGNCIVLSSFPWSSCSCSELVDDPKNLHRVFHLGSQTMTKLIELEGQDYSKLFSPPASLVMEEVDTPPKAKPKPKPST